MRDAISFINEKFDRLSTRGKYGALAVLTAAACLVGIHAFSGDDKNYVYLVDLEDKYEKEAILLDEDGNEVDISSLDLNKALAVVDSKRTKSGDQYQTILVGEDGKMISGFIDGKYLEDKSIDKVEVYNDVLEETNVVYAQNGLWLRDNDEKMIDNDTEDAFCLPFDSMVSTSSTFETSKSNSYQWKEAIYVNGDELKHGYLIGDYIRSDNFDDIQGKRFIIDSSIGLKLREDASCDSPIISTMENGSEVVLLPNVASISDGTYDWFYVATNTEEGIKLGYAAATYYTDNGVIHYLTSSEQEKKKKTESNEEMLIKVVDTSKDQSVPLKLRENPGIDSKIISKIEDGTKVYTYQRLLDLSDDSVEVDGHQWLQVYLTNGVTGYVAADYIKDEPTNHRDDSHNTDDSHSIDDQNVVTLDFDEEGKINGYFGIDVTNGVVPTNFEQLIMNDFDYTSSAYTVSRDLSSMKRPEFVMFKLGASYTSTSYSTATLAEDNYGSLDNLKTMVAICEENHVPYGFYYYSQAIDSNDVEIEASYIQDALSQLGTSSYHILPLAIDVEDYVWSNGFNHPTRALANAQENGKEYQTEVINDLMNRVREDNNIEVISYLSHSGYADIINHNHLDPINQQNPWIVNPSKVHSDDFATNYPDVVENVSMRQIALDGSVNNVAVDVNLIDQEYFDGLLEKNDLQTSLSTNKVLTKRDN